MKVHNPEKFMYKPPECILSETLSPHEFEQRFYHSKHPLVVSLMRKNHLFWHSEKSPFKLKDWTFDKTLNSFKAY